MASKYDDDGRFLGEYVENLTDGETLKCNPKRIPFGTLGQISPSKAIDEFQRDMFNRTKYYGIRTVYNDKFGSVTQVLVNQLDELAWVNL